GDTYYIDSETPSEEQAVEQQPENEYQDPADLASTGQGNGMPDQFDVDQWMPLGVFVITPSDSQAKPNRVFQFVISKNGQLAGTYFDTFSRQSIPIQGAVNKSTQQAAWTVGSNQEVVMETNLGSFVQNQGNVLVHERQQPSETWTMVRLPEPSNGDANQ
ncbi:MAG TPA: hypothetical protein DD670_13920, partial [Planctomycetaceae bacterium]|nr:hypothetical protein [Planctomycetaceae bacterium]